MKSVNDTIDQSCQFNRDNTKNSIHVETFVYSKIMLNQFVCEIQINVEHTTLLDEGLKNTKCFVSRVNNINQ